MDGGITNPEEIKDFPWQSSHGLMGSFQNIFAYKVTTRIGLDRHDMPFMATEQTPFHAVEKFGGLFKL
jgi:hypothetical protein